MHTMKRNQDGTWDVGRIEQIYNSSSVFVPMFADLKLQVALLLVSALNGGGDFDIVVRPEYLDNCAVKE